MNDYSQIESISVKLLGKITSTVGTVFLLGFLFFCFEIYVPVNPGSHETVVFTVQRGWSDEDIANKLKELGIIRSSWFFNFYAILSLKHSALQAGDYSLSAKMSTHEIANAMAHGDVIKNNVVIVEGWDLGDIGKYLEAKGVCTKDEFAALAKGHEGYLFPDTYEIGKGVSCEMMVEAMLANFDEKMSPELREEIAKQNKTISQVVTMASLIEKEVITLEDKKIVSGILWKRIAIGMPLQVDATIVYITGNPNITAKDKTVNSPYNTYKYYGLPKGPISEPGMDSILAAIYPTQTDYLYYLSAGKTIFSKTFAEHNAAREEYLGY